MSNAVLPLVPSYSLYKKPLWQTEIYGATGSKSEVRVGYQEYPQWRFTLRKDVLTDEEPDSEVKAMLGFINLHGGARESFRIEDPDDYKAVGQQIGEGDGETKTFQLIRSLGGFIEPCYEIKSSPAPKIYLDEVLQESGYSINATGLVTFDAAPADEVVITADFEFYYRVRLDYEEMDDFENFSGKLWRLERIPLLQVDA